MDGYDLAIADNHTHFNPISHLIFDRSTIFVWRTSLSGYDE
jgi:hypothetical protein